MSIDGAATARVASTGYVRVIGLDRVAIRSGAATEVVAWSDIILARSARNHVWVVTRHGSIRVRSPLQVVVDALAGMGLVQIHRRIAVNDAKVRRLVRSGHRRLEILLDDELRLEVGRQFQRMVRARFGAERSSRLSTEPRSAQFLSPERLTRDVG
jgi:DNA-binding LytR/AlgR family response regulator